MTPGNLVRAVIFFVLGIFVLGIIATIISFIVSSDVFDIVPNGIARYIAVLLPLILLFGLFIKAVQMTTKRNDNNRRY